MRGTSRGALVPHVKPYVTERLLSLHSIDYFITQIKRAHRDPHDCGPFGLVEINITIGMSVASLRCRRKTLRLVLRIGTTRELSALALKKSGANGSVTRSSLYLPRSSVGSGLSSPEPS